MADGNLLPLRITARYYALFCDRLEELDVDLEALLDAAGIPATALESPDGALSLQQMEALVREAHARCPRGDLGFELGLRIKPSSHEILGLAALSSATVGAALALLARYDRLMTPLFSIAYRSGATGATIEVRPIVPMSPLALAFHVDAIVASFHVLLDALVAGRASGFGVRIAGVVPSHARWRELGGARVLIEHDGLPGIDVVFDRAMIQLPLPLADRRSALIAQSWCESTLARSTAPTSVVDWVAMMLRHAGDAVPTIGDLARVLHLAPHTLERRLRAAGTRFRELAVRARHERACTMLRVGMQSVTEIAVQLGYGDVANFSRAFKRDAGVAPSAYRAATRVDK